MAATILPATDADRLRDLLGDERCDRLSEDAARRVIAAAFAAAKRELERHEPIAGQLTLG